MITPPASESRAARLRNVINELTADGWSVLVEPHGAALPSALQGFEPDLVARRGNEMFVVEFASRDTAKKEKIDALSRKVAELPDARFEVYWLGDEPERGPALLDVLKLTNEASLVSEASPTAALLTAWAAFEAAVVQFASKQGEETSWRSPRQLLSTLSSRGLISDPDFDRLLKISTLRNMIAHHGRAMHPSRDDLRFIIELTQRLATGKYISSDRMAEWFLERFEDPAHQLPYDGAEGGYQYFGNGPYDARDVLESRFPDAPETDIDAAVRLVEEVATEWVSKQDFSEADQVHSGY